MQPSLKLLEVTELGTNTQKGNLVGIQPYMEITDYANEEAFFKKLDGYFAEAASRKCFNSKTIIVLPEYVATWLLIANEKPGVYRAKSVDIAMLHLLVGNLGKFFRHFFKCYGKERLKFAIFRMKAESVLKIYVSVFSKLAKKYGVTIVAGSVVLPDLKLENGAWSIIEGPLYNTTLMFNPDGSADPRPLHKVFPTPIELLYTKPGDMNRLSIYQTPAGRLGVLNCADSWYADTYQKFQSMGGIDFLAVPSYVEYDTYLCLPWKGNNITPPPPEFDSKDFFNITYDDAWIKYAMPARFQLTHIKNAMNVFLRGTFWKGVGSDGRSIIIHEGKLVRGKDGAGAAIQNLWLS